MNYVLMNRFPIIIFAWFAFAALGLASEPVRLAISGDSAFANEADLITAELSKVPDAILLERQQILKIAAEHALHPDTGADGIKLGQLLGADGLLILSPTEVDGRKLIAARLVAVQLGVVIDEWTSPPYNAAHGPSTALVFSQRIAPLLQKLTVARKDAVLISMLNLRYPIRGSESLENQLTFLLTQQLVQRKEVFVLERRRMDDLVLEKALTKSNAEAFWTGSYVVDGEIQALSGDQLKIVIRLRPPGAQTQEKLEAIGTRTDIPKLVNTLTADLIQKLPHTTDFGKWSADQESKQYFKEAKWAFGTDLFPQARSAADASWALGNHDAALSKLRVRIYSALAFPHKKEDVDYGVSSYCDTVIDTKTIDSRINSAIEALNISRELIPEGKTKVDSETMSACSVAVMSASRILRKYKEIGDMSDEVAISELRAATREVGERLFALKTQDDYKEKLLLHSTTGAYLSFWYETPTDTVKAWKRLLAKRFTDDDWQAVSFSLVREQLLERRLGPNALGGESSNLPWLVAWHGESQAELDAIWEQFVISLESSTDSREKVDGALLRFAATNDGAIHRGERRKTNSPEQVRLCEQLWEARDHLITKNIAHAYFRAILDAFHGQLNSDYRERWLDHYLRHSKTYNMWLFDTLWDGSNMTRERAEKFYPLWKEFRKRVDSKAGGLAGADAQEKELMQRFPGLDGSSIPIISPVNDETLEVKHFWFPPEISKPSSAERMIRRAMQVGHPVMTAEHIWLPVTFTNQTIDGRKPSDMFIYQRIYKLVNASLKLVESLDPPHVVSKFEAPPGECFHFGTGRIHVTNTSVFIEIKNGIREGIQRMDRKTGQWSILPLPERYYQSVLAVNDDIFAGFSAPSNQGECGIFHYVAATGQSSVLASNRRQTDAGPLNTSESYTIESIFELEPGQIGTVIWRNTDHEGFLYDERKGKWEPLLPKGAEISVRHDSGPAILNSEECGIAIAQPGKAILPLLGSSFPRTGKLPSPPSFPNAGKLPKNWYSRSHMVFGAGKLWVIDYRDHPTLGMCNFLNVFTLDGKHSEIPLHFELPATVIATSSPISRIPKPVKLDENCVRIEWMAATEKGLTFFTGDASDRTYTKGIWFLPMSEINKRANTKQS